MVVERAGRKSIAHLEWAGLMIVTTKPAVEEAGGQATETHCKAGSDDFVLRKHVHCSCKCAMPWTSSSAVAWEKFMSLQQKPSCSWMHERNALADDAAHTSSAVYPLAAEQDQQQDQQQQERASCKKNAAVHRESRCRLVWGSRVAIIQKERGEGIKALPVGSC